MNKEIYSIDIQNLCMDYKDFSLDHVSLQVKRGTVMGFVGQNGAGKTTIIKSILNLTNSHSDRLDVFNLDVKKNEKTIKDDIGIVFDELGIPDSLTCKSIDKIMKNIYSKWNSDIFFSYVNAFKLPVNKPFKKYSRGMQMKVQTAIALSHDAKLLILDEATSGLDPIARNELLDILLEYMEDESHSIFMSSHITSDLERIADYITFINNGQILLSDEKYNIAETHLIAKGTSDDINSIPDEFIISTRKNSYGCEALITNPDAVKKICPNLIFDKPALDDILYFYVLQQNNLKRRDI